MSTVRAGLSPWQRLTTHPAHTRVLARCTVSTAGVCLMGETTPLPPACGLTRRTSASPLPVQRRGVRRTHAVTPRGARQRKSAAHLFSGAEAPACRQGVSAVSSLEWYPGGVLRHAACEQSARCDSPWKTEPGGLLAGNVANGPSFASPDRGTSPFRTHPPQGGQPA